MRILGVLIVALVLMGCSETENETLLGSTAPQAPNQFREVDHALLASKIDDVLEEVKSGNERILEFLEPSDCELYQYWVGDWISDKEIIQGWRQGYKFNDDGTYQELDDFGGEEWHVSEGGFYLACAAEFELPEIFDVGEFHVLTGRWAKRGNVIKLRYNNGDIETLTRIVEE